MGSFRTRTRNDEPDWLRRGSAYTRFMHYTPIEVFMVAGSLIGGSVGAGAYLAFRAAGG